MFKAWLTHMHRTLFSTVLLGGLFLLGACSRGVPSEIEGTWALEGILPVTVQFRAGEMESLGLIEKVSYKTDGKSILVQHEEGLLKGTSVRYTVIDDDTLHTTLGNLHRVKP